MQTLSLYLAQSKVISDGDSLTPGNYSLYVDNAREEEGYHFQMVDKSITQIAFASGVTNEQIAFITVRHGVNLTRHTPYHGPLSLSLSLSLSLHLGYSGG